MPSPKWPPLPPLAHPNNSGPSGRPEVVLAVSVDDRTDQQGSGPASTATRDTGGGPPESPPSSLSDDTARDVSEHQTPPAIDGRAKCSRTFQASSSGRNKDNGSACERTRLAVVFKDLLYSVTSNSDRRQQVTLLRGITGVFEPGQMTAVMGPSGSGKSTLLDVCAGRKTQGTLLGTVLYGNSPPSPALLRRYTGYVEQFDTLLDSLTVYEMLLYTAELKQPRSKPLAAKRADVEGLIERLALDKCRNTRIGKPLARGISGGQAKRTNVGIALITNPRVLFLDEPTSGLDSFTALEVMRVVKSLAADGTTLAATIHSPNAECFALFDTVMVVASGWVVYCGPSGTTAATYLSTVCGAPALSLGESCADHLVQFLAQADKEGRSGELHELYLGSHESQVLTERVDYLVQQAVSPGSSWISTIASFRSPSQRASGSAASDPNSVASSSPEGGAQQQLRISSQYVTPAWWSLKVLVQYRGLRNYSQMSYIGPRLWDKIAFALFIMGLYWGLGDKLEAVHIPALAAAFYLVVAEAAKTAVAYVPGIMLDRDLYIRERSDGLYRPITYLVYKVAEEMVMNMAVGAITCATVFFGVQMQGSFLYYWMCSIVTLGNGIAIAYAIAAWSPSLDVANAAVQTILTFLAYLCGFPIRQEAQPWYFRWVSVINPLRYSWAGLIKNQFEATPTVQLGGMSILQYNGLASVGKWRLLAYLAYSFGAWCTLAWVGLAFIKHHKR